MLLIIGGRIIDPKTTTDEFRDLVIDGNRIKYIGKFHPGEQYDEVIDAKGKIIVPGFIDAHVHFRDPGFPHKETIPTGVAAALRGGFTTVVCMANTQPVMDNPDTLAAFLEKAAQAPIHVKTVAAVSKNLEGKERTDFSLLKKQGVLGFSDDGKALLDPRFLHEALLAAKDVDMPVALHEEDTRLLGTQGVNAGPVADTLGVAGAPHVSESALVARDCMLALATGAKVHIQHISAAESVAAVRLAKALGARVTAEATPHHFSLTQDAVLTQGTLAKVNPPLRTEKDRYSIIGGLKDGTIDIIATDHAPHSADEKARPFPDAPSGMIGLETALALGITTLVRTGHLTLIDLVRKMTLGPADLYGIPAGFLAEGGPATLTIFDEREQWTVSEFSSTSSNSPFLGQTLTGKVKYTMCRGVILYRDQENT